MNPIRWIRTLSIVILAIAVIGGGYGPTAAAQGGEIVVLEEIEIDRVVVGVALSPDGEQLATVDEESICIWSTKGVLSICSDTLPNDVFSLQATRIEAASLAFSPDGKWLIFTENTFRFLYEPDLYLMDTTTGKITALTGDTQTGTLVRLRESLPSLDYTPAFSPDSSMVYFIRESVNAETRDRKIGLYRIPVTGGEAAPVADLPVLPFSVLSLEWLPGGQQLVMAITGAQGDHPANGIAVINADGTGFKNLYSTVGYGDVRPSADGKYLIAFNANIQGQFSSTPDKASSFVHTADGALAEPISADVGARWAAFDPDGTAIAYIGRDIQNPATGGLYIADAFGGPGRLVLEGQIVPANTRGTPFRPLMWAKNGVLVAFKLPALKPVIIRLGVRV